MTVVAAAEGERRNVSVIGPGRTIVYDSSSVLLGPDFVTAVTRHVPNEALEAVLTWLAVPTDD